MSVVLTLTGQIQLTDSNNLISVPETISISFSGTSAKVVKSALISTIPSAIPLDVSPTQFLFIKNLSGLNTVTVTWTPNGGASAVVQTLQPASAILIAQTVTNVFSGISALTVVASGGATPIEYILGG